MNKRTRAVALMLTAALAGCAAIPDSPRTNPVSTDTRAAMGRLAVRGPQRPDVTLAADLDTKGKAAGKTAAAAGIGWLSGTFRAAGEASDPLAGGLVAAFGLITAPVVAAGGAVYGASTADSAEDIESGNGIIESSLDFAAARFRRAFRDALGENPPLSMEFVEASASDAELAHAGFATVLDLRMNRLDTLASGNNYEVKVRSDNTISLRETATSRLLEIRSYEFETDARSVSGWAAKGGEALLGELDEHFAEVSRQAVDEFFLAPSIRLQGLRPVSAGWRRTRVDGLRPAFRWSALNGPVDTPPDSVRYRLELEEAGADTQAFTTRTQTFRPDSPLTPCKRYRWRVQAHYDSFGRPVTSEWTPHYRFRTPCERSDG